MVSENVFPVLDFANFKDDFEAFSKDVFDASNKWGFFILTGHGISKTSNMFDKARQFFDLPTEQKTEKTIDKTLTGYDGAKLTTFAASEGISFGLPPGGVLSTNNLPAWWDTDKRHEVEDFKSGCYDLSLSIMSCFAVQLGLDKSYFAKYHQHQDPGNVLKMIRYPRFEKQPDGVPRLSEHTDWGSITFVFTKEPGLEIRDPFNNWFDVPIIPDAVVVNIGDALSLWSNKCLKSTMHRISWKNLDTSKDRLSIAYFTHPNSNAILASSGTDPDNSKPLTYGEYLQIRSSLTYSSIQEEGQGHEKFDKVDKATLARIRDLNVANAGILKSHKLEVS